MLIFKGQAQAELAEVKIKKFYNGHQLYNGTPDYSLNQITTKTKSHGNFSTIKQ